jgi:hypothetical protein
VKRPDPILITYTQAHRPLRLWFKRRPTGWDLRFLTLRFQDRRELPDFLPRKWTRANSAFSVAVRLVRTLVVGH